MIDLTAIKDKRICVAVSGGADSVALLHYLKKFADEYGFFLSVLHCEHGIRGEESLEDMRFVKALCADWKVPLTVFSENCPMRAATEGVSLETAARNFRRECFDRLIAENRAEYIATAHHAGDEAETVLFRMARGSGLSGLAAIKEKDGYFLRPILSWSKAKILQYIEDNGLRFRVDSTNLRADATRNKLRLEALPLLEAAVPGATENIAKFAAIAKEDDELLCALAASLVTKAEKEILVAFSDKKPLFTRACLAAMKDLGVDRDYTSIHLNALYALQKSERGAQATLPKNLRAEKTENGLRFFLLEEESLPVLPEPKKFDLEGFEGGRYEVNLSYVPKRGGADEWKILRMDEEKLPKSAVFRFRREGDCIRRFGGGEKSLKKFFNEEKIPPKERAFLPLIAEADSGRVYAVCGVEISEEIKVDEGTKKVLYISIRKKV